MIKKAKTDYPIHELITTRWSPYRFATQTVPEDDLRSLLEAARWAPSSYNEQPWRFVVARKEDTREFDKLLSCLAEANRAWAKHASVLVLACTHTVFDRNGKPNKAAQYDLGAAVSYLSIEATSRGIAVHQMIGIDPDTAQAIYNITDGYEPLTAFAIGYADTGNEHEEIYIERDRTERERKKISDFVFRKEWALPDTQL